MRNHISKIQPIDLYLSIYRKSYTKTYKKTNKSYTSYLRIILIYLRQCILRNPRYYFLYDMRYNSLFVSEAISREVNKYNPAYFAKQTFRYIGNIIQ